MSQSDWVDDPAEGEWVDDSAIAKGPNVGGLESLARGGAQGLTLGWADELSGLGDTALHSLKNMEFNPTANPFTPEGMAKQDEINKYYEKSRDDSRANFKAAKEANPGLYTTGEIGGALGSAFIPGLGGSSLANMTALGAAAGAGASEADNTGDLLLDTAKGAGSGLALGGAGKLVGAGAGKLKQALGDKLKSEAEKLAVNATGATGAQSAKFADDAGRELLDRNLVRFGDNAESVAKRVSGAMDTATGEIDSALKALDAKGVTASADNVVAELQAKVKALQSDPSQAGVVKKLNGIIDNIVETGNSSVPISAAEKTKRGFNKAAGNWMDPEAGQAGKQAYLSYMGEVERAAGEAEPALLNKFKDAKETYGLLAPIEEAAQKRALTQNQAPFGGLGDWAAGGAGGATAGPIGAVAGVVGKKFLAPRVTSSLAVTADKISKQLLKSPQMAELAQRNPAAFQAMVTQISQRMPSQALPKVAEGEDRSAKNFDNSYGKEAILQKTQGSKYAQVMQNAANGGEQGIAAAHFVLSQRDPEYRKLIGEEQKDEH